MQSPLPLDSQQTDEIAALLALDSERSFVAAGRLLQRHPSILSKRLAAMESRLGIRLVQRSTRHIRLTEAGLQLVQRLRQATELIKEAEQQARLGATQIQGHLRLAVPGAMGRLWLAPRLPQFLLDHPQLTLEVDYSERFVDVIGEGFDAAIRIGTLADSQLVAQRLTDHRRILCASPAYLQRCGTPQSPKDLADHDCLAFSGLASHPNWYLQYADQKTTLRPKGSLVSNDSEALLSAAIAGIGILGAGDWLFARAIADGELVRVLPDWQLDDTGGIYFVRPSARFASAATLAMRDWLQAQFSL